MAVTLGAACAVAQEASSGESPSKRYAAERAQLVGQCKEQLRSDDLRTVAWGAFAAAQHRVTECNQELRAALKRLTNQKDELTRRAAIGVLDALFETAGKLPDAELEPFLGTNAGVVLLLRQPKDRALLLRAFRGSEWEYGPWRACGELLAKNMSPDFVAELLAMPHFLEIQLGIDIGPNHGTFSSDCRWDRVPDDWPRLPRFAVRLERAGSGDRVLLAEPVTIFVNRSFADHTDSNAAWFPEACSELRKEWLGRALGQSRSDVIKPSAQAHGIPWRDAATLVADTQRLKATMEREWRQLVEACVGKNLITTEVAASLRPTIRLWVTDCRQDQSVPLPEVK